MIRLVAVLVAFAAGAPPAAAQEPAPGASYDARALARASEAAPPPPDARTRRARAALPDAAALEIDPLTGTPRVLAGPLTPPGEGDPVALAQAYVREHLPALGLERADLGSLGGLDRVALPGGGTQVRWRQYDEGIPALDAELRVTVGPDGAVRGVTGAPEPGLAADGAPRLTAADALRAAGGGSAAVVAGPDGPEQATRFAGGHSASLVLVGDDLAWRVLRYARSGAVLDVAVDARDGTVLRAFDRVRRFQVYDRHPGDGTGKQASFGPWLSPGADTLSGPAVHAWSDSDDDDEPDADEEVDPGRLPAFAFSDGTGRRCDSALPCTWDSGDSSTWDDNREAGTAQAFHHVNTFHDELRDDGFTAARGAAEGDDPVLLHAFDGGTRAGARNQASAFTPPDGESPVLEFGLFSEDEGHRDVHSGDDAAVVYHEYAHVLTDRLVTYGDGWSALNTPQALAIGEGLSDFLALDRLDDGGPLGLYVDGTVTARRKPIACPAGSPCDGYTLADYGTGAGGREAHDDGEIVAQALWDLRGRLGAAPTRALVLEALPLVPTEPTLLDLRNALLHAHDGDDRLVWDVFARRGMGYFASTLGPADAHPVADFSLPPAGAPGAVSGTVTSADTGLPLPAAHVRVGGHDSALRGSGGTRAAFFAGVDGAGGYRLGGLPGGRYPQVTADGAAGHDPVTRALDVAPGAEAGASYALPRDWAATSGGARIADASADPDGSSGPLVAATAADPACGPAAAVDDSALSGASFRRPSGGGQIALTVALPAPVDVTGFTIDPGASCQSGPGAGLRGYTLLTAPDAGGPWTVAHTGDFALADGSRRVGVPLPAVRPGVRHVRLVMRSALKASSPTWDVTELAVHGRGPNALPSGALAVRPGVAAPGTAVTLDASALRDPDSRITGYDWDLDGNGSADRWTPGPVTSFAYGAPGTYAPRVTAHDFRGGSGSASAGVRVEAAATRPPSTPPPRAEPPRASVPRSARRGRVTVRVTCATACGGAAKLSVDARTARRLKLGRRRTVASARVRRAGRVTLRLTRRATRALRRAGLRRVTVRATVVLRDADGRRTTVRRSVRLAR